MTSDHARAVGTVISIGDFSRMTNLSVKALRHYHDLGLLEPAQVDRFTGYRSYDTGQVSTAQVIRRLRALQMPLDQIRSVLTAPDLAARNREIAAHLTRMERQLEATRASVATLRDLLEGTPAAPTVTFRRLPATVALAIEETVDASELTVWGTRAFAEIEAVRKRLGLAARGAPGALFPGDFFELERSRLTAFVPLEPGPAAAASRRPCAPAGDPGGGGGRRPARGAAERDRPHLRRARDRGRGAGDRHRRPASGVLPDRSGGTGRGQAGGQRSAGRCSSWAARP